MNDPNPFQFTGGGPRLTLPHDDALIETRFLRKLAWDRGMIRLTAIPYAVLWGIAAGTGYVAYRYAEYGVIAGPIWMIAFFATLFAVALAIPILDNGERAIDRTNPRLWRIKWAALLVPGLNVYVAWHVVLQATATLERRGVKVGFLRCDYLAAHPDATDYATIPSRRDGAAGR